MGVNDQQSLKVEQPSLQPAAVSDASDEAVAATRLEADLPKNGGIDLECIDEQDAPPIPADDFVAANEEGDGKVHKKSAQRVQLEQITTWQEPLPPGVHGAAFDDYDAAVKKKVAKNSATSIPDNRDRGVRDSVSEPFDEEDEGESQTRTPSSQPQEKVIEGDESRHDIETPAVLTADVHSMSNYNRESESQEILVPEATLVNDHETKPGDHIPAATIVEEEKFSLTIAGRKVHAAFICLGVVLVLGAVTGISVYFAGGSGPGPTQKTVNAITPTDSPTISFQPSPIPSSEPSTTPTSALRAELANIILQQSGDKLTFAEKSHSNQQIALDWLANDMASRSQSLPPNDDGTSSPQPLVQPLSDNEILERYVLALLYLETNGESWFDAFEFNSEGHVCTWRGKRSAYEKKGVLKCTPGNLVERLALFDNNLQGTLPSEIGLLSELTYLDIGNNDISGRVPSSLGILRNMTYLTLNGNDFRDRLPSSLEGLTKLEVLDLSNNEIDGPLLNATNWKSMNKLKVDGNFFTGEVPKSFGAFDSLEILHIQRNKLSGSVDGFMCANLPSEFELDCEGGIPDVQCTCCIGCTIVSDDDCDPVAEEQVFVHVEAGDVTNNFVWELFDYTNWTSPLLIAAGGKYENFEVIDFQLCLASPGDYYIQTSGNSSAERGPIITFTSREYNVSLGVSDYRYIFLSGGNDDSLQEVETLYPLLTPQPTLAPSLPPPFMTGRPTFGSTGFATPTVGTDRTLTPTFVATRPFLPTTLPPVQPPLPSPVLPPVSPPVTYIDSNCISLDIQLVTDAFGDETSFSVIDKNQGGAVVTSGNSYDSNSTYILNECLDRSGCYDFIIEDQWDDGMCCKGGNGSFSVSVLDRTIGSGGKFGSSETIFIGGSCGKNPFSDSSCDGSMKLLNVTIRTDNWGDETSWEVYDDISRAIYAISDIEFGNNTTYTEVKCIPGNKCYSFVIYDSVGDGLQDGLPLFHVGYDGNTVITSGGNFGESFTVSFGSGCDE